MQATDFARRAAELAENAGFRTEVLYPGGRKIAGSSMPSEHSYGNAVDIFGGTTRMKNFAKILNANRELYAIRTLCFDGGGASYDSCTTPHKDHIHIDFKPRCGGVVPTTGTDAERVSACNQYQLSGDYTVSEGGEFPNLNPFGGIMEGLDKALVVGVGVVIGVVAIVIVMSELKISAIDKIAGPILKGVKK